MLKNPWISLGSLALGAGAVVAFSCQSYNVNPVIPKAVELEDKSSNVAGQGIAPNLMLVVDRSGSMTDAPDGNPANCCASNNCQGCYQQGQGNCKWDNLLDIIVNGSGGNLSFIDQLNQPPVSQPGNPVQLGLTYFSGDTVACGGNPGISDSCAGGVVAVPVGPDAGAAIKAALLSLEPAGGTPSAATMAILPGAFPPPDPTLKVQRANYAILLTDGAPNCDSSFQPTAANCSSDRCTVGTCDMWGVGDPQDPCSCWGPVGNGMFAPIPQTCLDETGLVTAVQSLLTQNGIKTFVIGFGVANGGGIQAAIDTLNQAAIAGGVALDGGPTPPAGFNYYYAANNSVDLQAALNDIASIIATPCQFSLDSPPPSQQLIEVLVTPTGGSTTNVPQSGFNFDPSSDTVTITDPTICGEITSSTPNNPVTVEFKYLTAP